MRNLTSFPSSTGLPISQVKAHKQAMSTLAARQQPPNSSFLCHLQIQFPKTHVERTKLMLCSLSVDFPFPFWGFEVPCDNFRECGAFLQFWRSWSSLEPNKTTISNFPTGPDPAKNQLDELKKERNDLCFQAINQSYQTREILLMAEILHQLIL